jgi:hypothetical protein
VRKEWSEAEPRKARFFAAFYAAKNAPKLSLKIFVFLNCLCPD